MEDLNATEMLLQSQIETYKTQLQVTESNGSVEERGDSEQLLSDLKQLIELTEENLMEVKKQKLLGLLEPMPPGVEDAAEEKESSSSSEAEVNEEEDVVGVRCSAPLKESWEVEEKYHNAVIFCRETLTPSITTPSTSTSSPSRTSDVDPLQQQPLVEAVRVLFSQPLYAAMLPCPYFMEGSCRYSEDQCKYSHGHVVPMASLRPVQEPNYELLKVGGKCLARYSEDHLWYSAIMSCVGEECEVYFPSLSQASKVAMEHIFPIESSGESSDSGEESEGEEVVVEWQPQDASAAFGQWELHTKGIGSKLLSKMGYVAGQGLGRRSQGRLEPVEIVILPAGKSLDVCAALREAEKVRKMDTSHKRARRRRKKANGRPGGEVKEGAGMDMFDFLNTKILNKGKRVLTGAELVRKGSTPSSGDSSKSLNVKLFQLEEERKSLEKKNRSLHVTLQRHQKQRDKALEAHTRGHLAEVRARLEQLDQQEKSLQSTIRTKAHQKKLTIF